MKYWILLGIGIIFYVDCMIHVSRIVKVGE
jgi:hypothetical protein